MINSAITAAIRAGHEILKIYSNPEGEFFIERKEDNSPLTIADKAGHKIIKQYLLKTGLPLLSEEGKSIAFEKRKDWEMFWMVDPLDGTKEFIKRNGQFTVNIALIKKGKPVAGVIYVPVTKMLYAGSIENGAWKLNLPADILPEDVTFNTVIEKGEKLPVQPQRNKYVVAGSRSHMNPKTQQYIDNLRQIHSEIEIVASGSSLKICMVAEGAADEYPRFGPTMEWDTAAGHAILNAAGKKLWLTDFSEELQYNKENLLNPYFIAK